MQQQKIIQKEWYEKILRCIKYLIMVLAVSRLLLSTLMVLVFVRLAFVLAKVIVLFVRLVKVIHFLVRFLLLLLVSGVVRGVLVGRVVLLVIVVEFARLVLQVRLAKCRNVGRMRRQIQRVVVVAHVVGASMLMRAHKRVVCIRGLTECSEPALEFLDQTMHVLRKFGGIRPKDRPRACEVHGPIYNGKSSARVRS